MSSNFSTNDLTNAAAIFTSLGHRGDAFLDGVAGIFNGSNAPGGLSSGGSSTHDLEHAASAAARGRGTRASSHRLRDVLQSWIILRMELNPEEDDQVRPGTVTIFLY